MAPHHEFASHCLIPLSQPLFHATIGNDTDPAFRARAQHEEGTDLHGMLFRVNGAVIFCRGANMIPMEELEGMWFLFFGFLYSLMRYPSWSAPVRASAVRV